MKAVRIRTLYLSDRATWRLNDGRTVFVKMNSSDDPATMALRRVLLRRERKCLTLVRGLAAPEPLDLDPRPFLRAQDGPPAPSFLAETTIAGRRIDEAGLPPWRLIGAWAFLVEQLTAFRRHGLLYSDLKCDNVLVQKRPLKAMIVDFDSVNSLVAGPHAIYKFRYTSGHEAPEITRGRYAKESALTFSAVAMLVQFLTGRNAYQLRGPRGGLARAARALRREGAPALAAIAARCLDADPKKRPANYPELLKLLRAARLSPRIARTWADLRAPYAARLEELGLR